MRYLQLRPAFSCIICSKNLCAATEHGNRVCEQVCLFGRVSVFALQPNTEPPYPQAPRTV